MRLQVRFTALYAAIAAAAILASNGSCRAQSSTTSNSSSQNAAQSAPSLPAPEQTSGNGTYLSINPLAGVRYDNRYDLSLGMAYHHMKAGPNLLQGANLGGLDLTGSMWLSKHWGVQGSWRGFAGTSGAAPNAPYNIKGPFISEQFFTGGPEWLGPHNQHGAILAHVLLGGVYGRFEQDLLGQSPSVVGFYNNQVAPAAILGGHFDLNRSPRWVFRVTPDAVMTWYSTNYGNKARQWDVNFGISVGLEYRFTKIKRSTKKDNWVSGW